MIYLRLRLVQWFSKTCVLTFCFIYIVEVEVDISILNAKLVGEEAPKKEGHLSLCAGELGVFWGKFIIGLNFLQLLDYNNL